jgi:DNA modification methylase
MTVRILIGDVRDMLANLPAESVDCVVTSPPYWGLRDYGVEGQIGLERTLGEHLDVMVAVFDQVRRVMKPEATLWLNYGDTYATKPNGRSAAATKAAGNDNRTFRDKPMHTTGPIYGARPGSQEPLNGTGRRGGGNNWDSTLKPKDLCMIPNRLAIALQEAGWWVRSEIIWGKPNPMPDSSGRYRPSTAHEKIFMLAKSARSYYDAAAVAVPAACANRPGAWVDAREKQRGHSRRHEGFNGRYAQRIATEGHPETRFLRNYEPAPVQVWEMASAPFREAHFATFPPELAERCIKAGSPVGGVVLDPFGGAGTTGLVADRLQRDAILIELNPEYAELARRRIAGDAGLLADVEVAA